MYKAFLFSSLCLRYIQENQQLLFKGYYQHISLFGFSSIFWYLLEFLYLISVILSQMPCAIPYKFDFALYALYELIYISIYIYAYLINMFVFY